MWGSGGGWSISGVFVMFVSLKLMRYWVAHLSSALWFQIKFVGSWGWDSLLPLKATSITIGRRAIDFESHCMQMGDIYYSETYTITCTCVCDLTGNSNMERVQYFRLLLWQFWVPINQIFQIHRPQTGESRPKASRGSGPRTGTSDKKHNLWFTPRPQTGVSVTLAMTATMTIRPLLLWEDNEREASLCISALCTHTQAHTHLMCRVMGESFCLDRPSLSQPLTQWIILCCSGTTKINLSLAL